MAALTRILRQEGKKVAKSFYNLLGLKCLEQPDRRLRYMADGNALPIEFPGFGSRKIQADFSGGQVSSDGGVLLMRQVDRWIGLTKRLGQLLPDGRDPDRITHSLETLLQQRVYGLALGYEDLNDHDGLRHDPLWQTAAERDEPLGSSSTLCRWENRAGRKEAWLMHQVLFEQFVGSFEAPPEALTLDVDPTDDRVHGAQVGAYYHGYYGDYCFLPLYVFCGEQLLVSYLRPSNCDGARHAWAVLALLVKALRKQWPGVRIRLRAHSGLCRWKMLRWCERHGVEYVVGLAKNVRLNARSASLQAQAEAQHQATQQKVRLFGEFQYQAGSWDRPRRVIVKAEHTWGQPTLRGHQLSARAPAPLRRGLLRARGGRKPYQGATARPLQRSDQLPCVVA
jgi:Transposase DDE domain group 1